MNWIAQLLAAASALLVGFLWYNPKTFGTAWMKGVGLTEEQLATDNMPLRFGLAFLMALLISVFVASIGAGHIEEVLPPWQHFGYHGAQLGIIVVLPILVIISLFEQVDFKTIAINTGYWVVTLGVMGMIIGAMGPG